MLYLFPCTQVHEDTPNAFRFSIYPFSYGVQCEYCTIVMPQPSCNKRSTVIIITTPLSITFPKIKYEFLNVKSINHIKFST